MSLENILKESCGFLIPPPRLREGVILQGTCGLIADSNPVLRLLLNRNISFWVKDLCNLIFDCLVTICTKVRGKGMQTIFLRDDFVQERSREYLTNKTLIEILCIRWKEVDLNKQDPLRTAVYKMERSNKQPTSSLQDDRVLRRDRKPPPAFTQMKKSPLCNCSALSEFHLPENSERILWFSCSPSPLKEAVILQGTCG